MPTSVLWPFPWWATTTTVLLIVLLPFLAASVLVRRRNQRLQRLGTALRDTGLSIGPDLFAIGEDKDVMVVSGNRLAVADLKSWRVVQTLTWGEARVLKIYDTKSNFIEFRLVINGGAQTRRVRTYSIAGFGRLFVQSTKEGKPVEYVQS
jgi:hypothetical protein